MSSDEQLADAEVTLRREVEGLGVDELLALCYAFAHKRERLRLYLDVLRKRGGVRAQFACCLICFDLARQGDDAAQREFLYLVDTIGTLAEDKELVDQLVGGDQYLSFIWELLQSQLADADQRLGAEQTSLAPDTGEVASLDLLSDEDLGGFDIPVDEPGLMLELNEAVERFLGGIPGVPAYDPESGFRLKHRSDTERVEEFLRELDSLRGVLPAARGFYSLTTLFYATHLRSKSFFGAVNERKQELLRDGLREFSQSGDKMSIVVGVLGPMHADPVAWTKIAEVLLDYAHWLAGPGQGESLEAYDGVGRMVARDAHRGSRRSSRRRGARA
jgi:hypothetical protein